jgi:hypothetical protein
VGSEQQALLHTDPGWYDSTPVMSSAEYRTHGTLRYWAENVAIAVPPNKAGCGANGALFMTTTDGGHLQKNSLTCYTTGMNCSQSSKTLPLHANPPGFEDVLESSDNNMVRLPNGHLLMSKMFVRYSPTQATCCAGGACPASCRRGSATFWDSGDCGATWTEVRALPDTGFPNLDRGMVFADPYSSRLYYIANDTGARAYTTTYWVNAGLLVLDNWTIISSSLPNGREGSEGTALPNGRFYFTNCANNVPTLWFYDSATSTLSSGYAVPGKTCSHLVGIPTGGMPGNDGSVGISRIGSFDSGDYVRVSYPTVAPWGTPPVNRQSLGVSVIKITGSAASPTFSTVKSGTLSATSTTGSITDASVIDIDRNDIPAWSLINDALYYWHETSGVPGTAGVTTTIKGMVVRDNLSWSSAIQTAGQLSFATAWTFTDKNGDYVRAASFFDPSYSASPTFIPVWADGPNGNIVRAADYQPDSIQGSNVVKVNREQLFLGWDNQGGTYSSGVAVSSWGVGRLDVFGLGGGALWHSSYDSSYGWSGCCDGGFAPPPGLTFTSDPAAVSWGSGRIDIVVKASDNAIWHMSYDSSYGWSGWTSLGGYLTTGPGISSWGSGRLDIFALGGDSALYHKSYDSSFGWSGWDSLGGSLKYAPAAVSPSYGAINIVAVGSDNAMKHISYDPTNGWSAFSNLDGYFTGRPAITAWSANHLDVFAVGSGGILYHKAWDSAFSPGWSGWLSIPDSATSFAPGAVSWGSGRIDLFHIGAGNAMRHTANN